MYSAESEALTEWKVSEVDKRVYDPPERLWNVHSHAAYTTWEDTSVVASLNCTHFTQNRKLLALSLPIASSDRPPTLNTCTQCPFFSSVCAAEIHS